MLEAFVNFFRIVFSYSFAVQIAVVSFSLVLLMNPVIRSWGGVGTFSLRFACVFVAEVLINAFFFALASLVPFFRGVNFPLSHLIVVAVYVAFFSSYPLRNRLVLGSTVFASAILLSELGAQIVRLISSAGHPNNEFEFVSMFVYLFILLFAVLMKKVSLNEYYELPISSTVLVLIINVAAAVVEFSNFAMFTSQHGDYFFCVVLVALYVVSVSSYLIVWFHCRERNENTRLQIENKLLEADKNMLELSDRALEEMRELRHDIRNQYMVMDMMLSEGRFGELKEYFDSMKTDTVRYQKAVDTGNPVIDSVVNMEVLKAAAHNVAINYRIHVPPELGISKSDLCRILVNLMDNAIEGVLRTDAEDFSVDCTIEARSEYLYICIQNAINMEEDMQRLLHFNTVKTDYINHGYGHKIVKRIVERHHGYIKYSVEDGVFIAEAILETGRI